MATPTRIARAALALIGSGLALVAGAGAAAAQTECLDPYALERAIQTLAFRDRTQPVTVRMLPHCSYNGMSWAVDAVEGLPRSNGTPVLPRSRAQKEAALRRGRALRVRVDGYNVVLSVRDFDALFLTKNKLYTHYFRVRFKPTNESKQGAAAGGIGLAGKGDCATFLWLTNGFVDEYSLRTGPAPFANRVRLTGKDATAEVVVQGGTDLGELLGDLDGAPHFAVFRWRDGSGGQRVPITVHTHVAGVSTVQQLVLENRCPALPPIPLRDGTGVRLHAGLPFIGLAVGKRKEYEHLRYSVSFDVLFQHPLNLINPNDRYENTLIGAITGRFGNDLAFLGVSAGYANRDVTGDRESTMFVMPHLALMPAGNTIGVTLGGAYYGFDDPDLRLVLGIEFDFMGMTGAAGAPAEDEFLEP